MGHKRFMAIIHLRSRWSRAGVAATEPMQENPEKFAKHVRAVYPDAEAVLSIEQGCIYCLTDTDESRGVYKKLAGGLYRPDQLSVVEIGEDLCTSHTGLSTWHNQTRWFTRTANQNAR